MVIVLVLAIVPAFPIPKDDEWESAQECESDTTNMATSELAHAQPRISHTSLSLSLSLYLSLYASIIRRAFARAPHEMLSRAVNEPHMKCWRRLFISCQFHVQVPVSLCPDRIQKKHTSCDTFAENQLFKVF